MILIFADLIAMSRPLMGGLLLTLFHHPAHIAARVLDCVHTHVVQPAYPLPPSLISELCGDPVLSQVAYPAYHHTPCTVPNMNSLNCKIKVRIGHHGFFPNSPNVLSPT